MLIFKANKVSCLSIQLVMELLMFLLDLGFVGNASLKRELQEWYEKFAISKLVLLPSFFPFGNVHRGVNYAQARMGP